MVWHGRGHVHCVTWFAEVSWEALCAQGLQGGTGPGSLRRPLGTARAPPDSERQQYHLVATDTWLLCRTNTDARSFGNIMGKMVFHASAAYATRPRSFYPSALPVSLCAGRQSEALRRIYFYFYMQAVAVCITKVPTGSNKEYPTSGCCI